MTNVQWHGPTRNPLALALEVAQKHRCTSSLYESITAMTRWDLFEENDFLDDLLQEIAGSTGIVVQHRNDGWYACMDTPDLHTIAESKVRYYALLDTSEIAFVGEFESITAAFDHQPGRSVWMVDDKEISEWISTVQAARNGTLPPIVSISAPPAPLSE